MYDIYIIYDILKYGLSPYFLFQDELIHLFFKQEVKISVDHLFEDTLIIVMASFTLFKIQAMLRNYINKDHYYVSIKT